MIWNEIRNRIEAKGDIQESKNNSKNKERKEYQNQKERESGSLQVVSVCVKGKARAYEQCAQNNNKINCRYKITKQHDQQITK